MSKIEKKICINCKNNYNWDVDKLRQGDLIYCGDCWIKKCKEFDKELELKNEKSNRIL